jgi:NAD(P)-dependent dehydrogenase (short-subunit alcohol dehydrogenase family)
MMERVLAGKKALVVCDGSGIGGASVERLRAAGAAVFVAEEASEEDAARVVQAAVAWLGRIDIAVGPPALAKEAAVRMLGQGRGGAIVSVGGSVASSSVLMELAGRDIRMNAVANDATAIHPEVTRDGQLTMTSRIPLAKLESAADVAHYVLYFVSPSSADVTGSTLVIDGAYLVA